MSDPEEYIGPFDAERESVLKKARKRARALYEELYDGSSHPSFAAAKALEQVEEEFSLRSYGVEGWSNKSGTGGYSYLNTGDPYGLTLVARTTASSCQIMVSCWGNHVR